MVKPSNRLLLGFHSIIALSGPPIYPPWGGLKKPHIFLKMKYNLASLYENASLKHVNFDYVLNSQI